MCGLRVEKPVFLRLPGIKSRHKSITPAFNAPNNPTSAASTKKFQRHCGVHNSCVSNEAIN